MECEVPTVNSNKSEIKDILKSVKSIAVMGLSPNPEKDSHRVAKYLQEAGYKIYPVYPKEDTILGEKVYRALTDISEKVDMVNVFRKPAAVAPIVDKAIERGDVDVIWTQIGIVNNEAGEKATANGMRVVQNQCSMVEHRTLI